MSNSPTLRDVWSSIPAVGRAACVVAAAGLVLATGIRLGQMGGHGTAPAPAGSASTAAAPRSSSPSRSSIAYGDGYRMGLDLLSLGIAPVPAGMNSTADSACAGGVGANVDVQESLTRDLDQKAAWYAGCRDAVQQKPSAAPSPA